MWFGWNGLASESTLDCHLLPPVSQGCQEIPMAEPEIEHFYRGFSNCVLWPTLHGWPEDARGNAMDWIAYKRINARYASAILNQLRPSDRIWIHDYHLMLVPDMVRTQGCDAPVSFFLHTPFPAVEDFVALPQAHRLIKGTLGADTIGFHTREYARNFLDSARHFGYAVGRDEVCLSGRRIQVKHWPMGIDWDDFTSIAQDPAVMHEVRRLRSTKTPQLMLGVDRLDYTKGIPKRLVAFEQLLERHPELHRRVSLQQVAVPTRDEIPAYRDLRLVVERLIDRINARFGSVSWTPVDCFFGSVDLHTLVALYQAADVMLVTPERDGLNLVGKEFVASRVDGDGVLILSKFAGVANELTDALQVDPNDLVELSSALHTALHMPLSERRRRMRRMRRKVQSNSLYRWASEFIDEPNLEAAVS
jgi:trehalose 6-phosphate synthase/phosphatase